MAENTSNSNNQIGSGTVSAPSGSAAPAPGAQPTAAALLQTGTASTTASVVTISVVTTEDLQKNKQAESVQNPTAEQSSAQLDCVARFNAVAALDETTIKQLFDEAVKNKTFYASSGRRWCLCLPINEKTAEDERTLFKVLYDISQRGTWFVVGKRVYSRDLGSETVKQALLGIQKGKSPEILVANFPLEEKPKVRRETAKSWKSLVTQGKTKAVELLSDADFTKLKDVWHQSITASKAVQPTAAADTSTLKSPDSPRSSPRRNQQEQRPAQTSSSSKKSAGTAKKTSRKRSNKPASGKKPLAVSYEEPEEDQEAEEEDDEDDTHAASVGIAVDDSEEEEEQEDESKPPPKRTNQKALEAKPRGHWKQSAAGRGKRSGPLRSPKATGSVTPRSSPPHSPPPAAQTVTSPQWPPPYWPPYWPGYAPQQFYGQPVASPSPPYPGQPYWPQPAVHPPFPGPQYWPTAPSAPSARSVHSSRTGKRSAGTKVTITAHLAPESDEDNH